MAQKLPEGFTIRQAEEKDAGLILSFIKWLAVYEKMLGEVHATEEGLRESLFVRKQAEVMIGEYRGEPAAFALYFHNFSTFVGRANLYLEDIFVKEEYRGKGFGKAMFRQLAQIAVERGCLRLDWWCLDWNEPSIRFYKSMGAKAMDQWTVYRLEGEALRTLAEIE